MTTKSPVLPLLLLLPAPSISVLLSMVIAPGCIFGKLIFLFFKLWILLIPLFWLLVIEKQKLSCSRPRCGGLTVGAALGIFISIIIVIMYAATGRFCIQPQMLKQMASKIGLTNPYIYLAAAAYWILLNSLLEEYVWRWFVVKQCRLFMTPLAAIIISAIFFTLHHIIAMQIYLNWLLVTIASMGIFSAAALWSWCYLRYQSIWPGYLSHAIVDITVFAIGYHLIFQ